MTDSKGVPDERGEFALIRELLELAGAPGAGVLVGPGDDAAVVAGGGIVLSTDLSVEGVHFRADWLSPEEIGFRATAAALSDLAAMGAEAVGVLLSLALPVEGARGWATAAQAGCSAATVRAGGTILGGDLSRTPPEGPRMVNVTVVGRTDRPVRRDGAQVGHSVWVSGALGGAAGAVREWERGREPAASLRQAFARPPNRLEEARWLRRRVELGAMIDLSDGLVADAGHLARASGVGVVLDADHVPVHPGLGALTAEGSLQSAAATRLALRGGEDYELCFTAPADLVTRAQRDFGERFGVGLTRVGEVTSGAGVSIVGRLASETGAPGAPGFDHFGQ